MTSLFSVGDRVQLKIESLASNGAGVAKHEGLVIFVPNTCPGDVGLTQITKKKKSFAEAQLIELTTPSSERREPPCPVAKFCGGCDWQHISYPEQLRQKKKIIEDALKRVAKLKEWPDFEVESSPKEYRYRNRIQVHYQKNQVGYYAKNSNSLIAIDDCLIADEKLTTRFDELKQASSKKVQRAEIRIINDRAEILKTEKLVGFTQINTDQNEQMLQKVQDLVTSSSQHEVIDFYCGQGNFSLPLARKLAQKKFTGVEINSAAIDKAKENSQSLENIDFICSDVLHFMKQTKIKQPFLALIDPTREGCQKEFIENLAIQNVDSLIYISCNPSTWARDLALLNQFSEQQWKIESLSAFDMFPQTPHVEVVSLLTRSSVIGSAD